MKTVVSKEACIGCGLCASMSPELYDMDDDGKAVPLKDSLSDDEVTEANEAAESCPTEAIAVI